jgi:hypothetical protein
MPAGHPDRILPGLPFPGDVMQKWISRSSFLRQSALAVGAVVVGLVLVLGFRHFQGNGDMLAGFLLGVLLLGIGAAGLAVAGTQTVTVDPACRRIVVEDRTLLGAKTREIAFTEIQEVSIGYQGKKSNFIQTYYLVLKLTSGSQYPLFAPGRFYAGASSRPTVEGWRRRLQEYMAT